MEECKEYDDLFSKQLVSSLGRYQKIVFFSSCTIMLLTSFQFAFLLFVYGTPNFHCQPDNSSVSTCPANKCCANCTSYVFDGPFTSVVSEWNLICDQAYISANLQACFYAGMLPGSVISGIMSDSYGRMKSTYCFVAILVISSFTSVFADSIYLIGFLRFLSGVGVTGNQTAHFTSMLELLGPQYRTMVSGINQTYFGIGYLVACFVAYFVRDWRTLVLITSLPGLLLFVFIRVLPESPRWLLSQNRLNEAHKTLSKCREASTKKVNPEKLKEALENIQNVQSSRRKDKEKNIRYTPLDLVRTPKLRKRSVFLAFNWFTVSFLGNALFLNVDDLSGNIYLNFTIVSCLYPLAVIITWIFAKRLGRRLTHSGFLLITGLLCLFVLAIHDDHSLTRNWLLVAGIATTSGLWLTIFLMGTELFPTVLRTTAVGTGYTIGRFGAILAPYVGMIGQLPGLSGKVPLILYGVLSIITAIMSLWLPETLNSTMHQTVEEEESAKDDYSLPCCTSLPTPEKNDTVANHCVEVSAEKPQEVHAGYV